MTDKPLSERLDHIQEHWNEYHRSEIYTLASALKRVLAKLAVVEEMHINLALSQGQTPSIIYPMDAVLTTGAVREMIDQEDESEADNGQG